MGTFEKGINASDDDFKVGAISNADEGDYGVGFVYLNDDPGIDLFNALSGGDGDFTDGDYCECGDVGDGGTDCAG